MERRWVGVSERERRAERAGAQSVAVAVVCGARACAYDPIAASLRHHKETTHAS